MKRTYLIIILILFFSGQLFAQQRITGQVRNNAGETLPGVNVVIKGTTTGAITDIDGRYLIEGVPANGALIFSFMGMLTEEISVGNQTQINITLLEDIQSLDEVVIVGYGSVKRANLTGAVVDISSREIQDVASTNLSTALEGRLAGVRISLSSGKPGAPTSLKIRESSSYSAAEDPLYVIDGIIRDKDAFDILDPSEVESISILKDGSAAVYGAKSAGGVVLVQTKKGKQGKIKVNYSSSIGITHAFNITEMLSAYEHAKMLNDGYDIQKFSSKDPRRYAQDELDYFRDSIPGGGYDWLDGAWKNAALYRHNLNLSGGTDVISYFIGGNYLKETGSIEGLYVSKYSIRSSIEVLITKGLTASFEASFSNRKDMTPINPNDTQSDVMEETFRALLQNPRWIPPTINGLPVSQGIGNNPYSIWVQNVYKRGEANSSNLLAALEYKFPFLKGLRAKIQVNQTKYTGTGKSYYEPAYGYNFVTSGSNGHIIRPDAELVPDIPKVSSPVTVLSGKNQLEESAEISVKYQTNATLAYSNSFGKHEINTLLVCEVSEEEGRRIGWQYAGGQVISGKDMGWAFSDKEDRILAQNAYEKGDLGFIGRLNYNYASKYIGEFSFRHQASSKFSPQERWGFFPSISVGWIVSEEGFFKNNISAINFMKIRTSAGLLGNDGVRDFLWLSTYGTTNGVLFGNEMTLGIEAKNAGLVNKSISWQKTQSYNGGLDLKFLNSKLSLAADVFYKYTWDILAAVTSTNPTTVGIPTSSNIRFNYGKMHAYGYEIELGYNGNVLHSFNYYIKGNFAWAEAMKLKVAQSPGAIGTWRDELKNSIDNQPGAISTGIIRTQEEIDDILMDNPNYNIGRALELGMLNYLDIRGTDGSEGPNGRFNFDLTEDRTVIARKTSPPYFYGSSLGVSFKGIKLDMTFSGKFGHELFYDKEVMTSPTTTANVPSFWADHWTAENPNAAFPRANAYGLDGNYSIFWKRKGHTLRLTDLNLSYSLPGRWSQRFGMNQFRVFFNTKYLWTIINPFDYKDANLSKYNGYPMTRTYNLGVNVNF